MHRVCLVLLLLLGLLSHSQAEEQSPLAGHWLGVLKVEVIQLRLVFTFEQAKDGKLTATMLSLDQNRAVLPAGKTTFTDNKVSVELPLAGAQFTGTLDAKTKTISGEFTQNGKTFPLTLKAIDKIPMLARPQTPKPPYPYQTEDVTFRNEPAKITLAGTLTWPKTQTPSPAVILISGSGPQDRDCTIHDHKIFRVLADHLTRAGFAVLRYDDRGTGQSQGHFASATTQDFATDVAAAITFLQSRTEVDRKRIGLIGHSEGGIVAPLVCVMRPKEVAFAVLLAGPAIPGTETIGTQIGELLKQMKTEPEEIRSALKLQRAAMSLAVSPRTRDELNQALTDLAKTYLKELPENKKTPDDTPDKLATKLQALGEPWMRAFLRLDPAETLRKTTCPILAVYFEKDRQVVPGVNQIALEKLARKNVQVKLLPGLNHLMQKAQTGMPSEYSQIEETINPVALCEITDWVKNITGQ
jgi:pimeloyl-ACP methyl ester carboxylesterase